MNEGARLESADDGPGGSLNAHLAAHKLTKALELPEQWDGWVEVSFRVRRVGDEPGWGNVVIAGMQANPNPPA